MPVSFYPKFEEHVKNFPEQILDDNQKTIINERCVILPNGERENWKQIASRVALAAAKDTANYPNDSRTVEDDAIDFFTKIYTMQMTPATPVLLNAGTSHQQLFSCFASVVKDDMKEQYDLKYTAAKIFSLGAGIGYNFSFVRAKDSIVGKNGALAYGVLKLMYALHVNCEMIKTGSIGRRGAQLAALDVYHPEIFKFVACKTQERHFKSFNISVILDKNFLEAVKNDEMITCRVWKNERPPKYRARRLWNKIVNQGWLNGEPGILFMDNANENSPIAHYGKVESCNPCLHGDTLISTDNGEIPIRILAEQFDSFLLKTRTNSTAVSKAWYTGERQCIKLTLEDGTHLICTPDHKITYAVLDETISISSDDRVTRTYDDDAEAWTLLDKKVCTESGYQKVVDIEDAGIHKVYDFSEPIDHHGWANGIYVHNCGEIPTVDWGSCNLGSINLLACMNADGTFNYDKYEQVLRTSVRFLDNLISINDFPDKKFKKVEEHIRSIGVSLMGFADLLIKMKIPYDSQEGFALGEKLAKIRYEICEDESKRIASVRGIAPVFEGDGHPKRRNAFLTTQAPSGSVSMIANCSPSMEPIFGLTMTKRCLDGKHFTYVNSDFEAFLKSKRIPDEHLKQIMDHVFEHGSIKNLPELLGEDDMVVEYWAPEEVKHFVTAHDINYKDRVRMQEAFQKHTDQAISSTVNLPETATTEEVSDMIMLAHASGLKGICLYRSGSRTSQVLNVGNPDKNSWLCLTCGHVNVETDPDLDPSKVCIRCSKCGAPSCSQK